MLLRTSNPFGHLLVDRTPVADREDPHGPRQSIHLIDDPVSSHPVLAVSAELPLERFAAIRVSRDRPNGFPDGALEAGRLVTNPLRGLAVGRAPLARALFRPPKRYAEYLLERQAFAASCEMPAARPDLPHEAGVAERVERFLQPLALLDVDENRSRPSVARDDDLL